MSSKCENLEQSVKELSLANEVSNLRYIIFLLMKLTKFFRIG